MYLISGQTGLNLTGTTWDTCTGSSIEDDHRSSIIRVYTLKRRQPSQFFNEQRKPVPELNKKMLHSTLPSGLLWRFKLAHYHTVIHLVWSPSCKTLLHTVLNTSSSFCAKLLSTVSKLASINVLREILGLFSCRYLHSKHWMQAKPFHDILTFLPISRQDGRFSFYLPANVPSSFFGPGFVLGYI